MKTRFVLLICTLVGSLLIVFTAIAQENTQASFPAPEDQNNALVRVLVYARATPALDIYLNDEVFVQTQEAVVVSVTFEYEEVAAGNYTFTAVPLGESIDAALMQALETELEAGHVYSVAIIGSAADNVWKWLVIDETDALQGVDLSTSAVRIYINSLYGTADVDLYTNDVLVAENLAFGDYTVVVLPTGDTTEEMTYMILEDDPETRLGPPSRDTLVAGFYLIGGVSGRYPGEPGPQGDYSFLLGMPSFLGELNVLDGGNLNVGESKEIALEKVGDRVRFDLTLEATTTLSMVLTSPQGVRFVNPYLRIYDGEGNVLYENDDLNADSPDAGFEQLELEAGDYIVEAASWRDAFPNVYSLQVETVDS